MAGTAARGHWCVTCGTYIRPGTHGIHEMPYGEGARAEPEDTGIGNAHAVALVVTLIAGFVGGVFLIALWVSRVLR